MNVDNLANRHFSVAGSNRGFSVATYIQVFVLMRHLLPVAWSRSRAPTVRLRLITLAGKLVHHGRQWALKLCPVHHPEPDGHNPDQRG